MTRNIIALIGLALLVGCSSGGGDGAPSSSPSANNPTPSSPTEFLVATPAGLWRGQANGQGDVVFKRSNLHQLAFGGGVVLGQDLVYYNRESPPVIMDFPNEDIWSVRTDGTGDHAVLNTGVHEYVKAANGPIAIYEQTTYGLPDGVNPVGFGSISNDVPTVLPITEKFTAYRFMVGNRAYFNNEHQIFSTHVNGSDLRTHVSMPVPIRLDISDAFDNTLVFREYNLNNGTATLQAVPISGGSATALNDGHTYVAYADHVGARIVYYSCGIEDNQDGTFRATECDVHSVNTDGSGVAVLASHPANEAVQGIIDNQVIIRRNLSGNDELLAVPITGGPERLVMTITDNEFVDTIVGDTIVLRRPTGTWTLDLNGNLTRIGTKTGLDFFRVVGDSICSDFGEIWCLPIDGSRAEVRIDRNGKFVGVL